MSNPEIDNYVQPQIEKELEEAYEAIVALRGTITKLGFMRSFGPKINSVITKAFKMYPQGYSPKCTCEVTEYKGVQGIHHESSCQMWSMLNNTEYDYSG
jgi:hypothetical protein